MARADWTYELPPITGDGVWLEEYLVYDQAGDPVGKVFAVLDYDGRRWLGIEREHLPARHDRRVVPFQTIRGTDHENLAVHLPSARRRSSRRFSSHRSRGWSRTVRLDG